MQPERPDCPDPQAEGPHPGADWTDGEDGGGGPAAHTRGRGRAAHAAADHAAAPAHAAHAADDDERAGASHAGAAAHVHAARAPGWVEVHC